MAIPVQVKAIASRATHKLALVDADIYRVEMLFPKPLISEDLAALMKQNVLYCLRHGYDVIWDSIFYANDRNKKYLGEFFNELHPEENYIFNFDVMAHEQKAGSLVRSLLKNGINQLSH